MQAAEAGVREKVRVTPGMTLAHMTQLIMPQHANSLGITFGGQVGAPQFCALPTSPHCCSNRVQSRISSSIWTNSDGDLQQPLAMGSTPGAFSAMWWQLSGHLHISCRRTE